MHFIETLGAAQSEIRDGLDPRLQLELALVKVTRPQVDHSMAALEERLRRLEAGPAAAAPAPARQVPRTATPPREAGDAPAPPATKARRRRPRPRTAPAGDAPAVAASEAATEPPPAPAVSAHDAGELTLERVKRAWDLVLQRLQTSSPALFALLRDARPATFQDGHLAVAIHSNVALTRARMPGNPEILAAAVEATLGAVVSASFVPGEPSAAPQPSAPEAQADLDFTAFIKQAGQVLDAEPLPDDS